MIKPKVAVILPVYNVMPHIKSMISSFCKSTSFPAKLIVIDGFSEDGTYEYFKGLEEYENIEIYQIPKKGLVNAINFGIEKAGDLDVYLTQADVIHYELYKQDWLENFYNASKEPNVGMVTGRNGGGTSGPAFIDGFIWAGTWATYITRRCLNEIKIEDGKWFDEQFSGGDDIDFSYRVMKNKFRYAMVDYWVHHHQLTDRNDTHSSENIEKMGKLFKKKWQLN